MSENRFSRIRGNPIDLELLLDLAEIDLEDLETASQWWDEHASEEWIGALDSTPIDDSVL